MTKRTGKYFVFAFSVLLLHGGLAIASDKNSAKNKIASQGKVADCKQNACYLQGFDFRIYLNNYGILNNAQHCWPCKLCLHCESYDVFPINSSGLWIGALVDTSTNGVPHFRKAVTIASENAFFYPQIAEMSGNPDGRDSFYITSIDRQNLNNRRDYDDDADGVTDEDELNGTDDDHDGKIDEDYGAVSENDAYVAYYDIYDNPYLENNTSIINFPLDIKVWQRSFAWKRRMKNPILPFEFYIINNGDKTFRNVYAGMMVDPELYPRENNSIDVMQNPSAVYELNPSPVYSYFRQNRFNTVGFTLLDFPRSLDSLQYTLVDFTTNFPFSNDNDWYDLLASGRNEISLYPYTPSGSFLISFGPVASMYPGDTLKVTVAFVAGNGADMGENNFRDNVLKAHALYRRNFYPRPVLPSPPLKITKDNNKVMLNWKSETQDSMRDPLKIWDERDSFLDLLPATHWRKSIPPTGHTKGGRTFEAFRVWRSESPTFKPNTFGLLKQFDVADDFNLELQTGLQFSLVDSNLNPERL